MMFVVGSFHFRVCSSVAPLQLCGNETQDVSLCCLPLDIGGLASLAAQVAGGIEGTLRVGVGSFVSIPSSLYNSPRTFYLR